MTQQLVLSATDLSTQLPNLAKFIKKHNNQKLSEIYEKIAKYFGYDSYHHLITEHRVIRPFNNEKSLYTQVCEIDQLIQSNRNDKIKCIELLNRFECVKLITSAFICHPNVHTMNEAYYSIKLKYKDDYFFNVYSLTSVTHLVDIKNIIDEFHLYLNNKQENDSEIKTTSFKLSFFQVPDDIKINTQFITPPDLNNQTQKCVLYMHNYSATEFEKYSTCQFFMVLSSESQKIISLFDNFKSNHSVLQKTYTLGALDPNVNKLISACYKTQCQYTQSTVSYTYASHEKYPYSHRLSRDIPSLFTHLLYDSSYNKESNSRELCYTYAEQAQPNQLSETLCNPLDVISQKVMKGTKWNYRLNKKHFLFKDVSKETNFNGNKLENTVLVHSLQAYSKYLNEYKQSVNNYNYPNNSIVMNVLNHYNRPIVLETFTHGVYTPDSKKQVKTGLFGTSGSGKSQLTTEIIMGMMNKQQKGFVLSTGYDYARMAEMLSVPFIAIERDLSNINLDLFQYITTDKYSNDQIELLIEYLTCVLMENTYTPIIIHQLLQNQVYSSLSDFLTHCNLTLRYEFKELMTVKEKLDLNNNLIVFDLESMHILNQDFFDSVTGILLSLMSLYVDRYVIVDAIYPLTANYAISKNWYCLYATYEFNDLPYSFLSQLDNVVLLQLKSESISRVLHHNGHMLNPLFRKYNEDITHLHSKYSVGSSVILLNLTPNPYDKYQQYDISEEIVKLFFPFSEFIQTLGSYRYTKFEIPTIHLLLNEKPLSLTRAKELFNVLKQ